MGGACRYDQHPLSEIPQRDDELFDVVDANDQVIGQEKRAVVHRKKLLHRAVHAHSINVARYFSRRGPD